MNNTVATKDTAVRVQVNLSHTAQPKRKLRKLKLKKSLILLAGLCACCILLKSDSKQSSA